MDQRTCTIDGCTRKHYGRGLCSRHYQRAAYAGTLDHHKRTLASAGMTLDERLRNIGWTERVRIPELGPCWEWNGTIGTGGYGQLAVGKQSSTGNWLPFTASRAAHEAWTGPIPESLSVLHRCDNRPCINPKHLFLGTTRDNAEDMVAKGRSNYSERSPVHKFTDEQIAQVRTLRDAGMTYAAIGDQLGMTRHHASLIVRGLRRARVTAKSA